ncbi:MAG: serine/threonine protein kinase [Planctomycetaceae bacterium]|nr:serine/threonine protein kinase [Planctomycetaceae bacterium]
MKFTFAPESRPLDGYTIKRAIYRGGFGEVYYALTDAGREVALKLLQNNSEVELRGVQQCLNLSHPNLVTIFDVKRDRDGDHWIVMEYVAGETLDAAIHRHPSGMPMEEVRNWLRGMAEGVAFLHDQGIVHRDLKPGNVFSERGNVKIGDVGLSKFITPSRRSAQTQSVGTVYYMAPEVAKGRYGREVDVYALGIILYEMITGHVPFDGESTGEILMKHLSEQPDLTKLPPRLQPVIGTALQKDPARRFATVRELQQAFADAVIGRAAPVGDAVHVSVETPRRDQPPGFAVSGVEQAVSAGLSNPTGESIWWPTRRAFGIILLVATGLVMLTQARRIEGLFFALSAFYAGYILYTAGRRIRPQWAHPLMSSLDSGSTVFAPGRRWIAPASLIAWYSLVVVPITRSRPGDDPFRILIVASIIWLGIGTVVHLVVSEYQRRRLWRPVGSDQATGPRVAPVHAPAMPSVEKSAPPQPVRFAPRNVHQPARHYYRQRTTSPNMVRAVSLRSRMTQYSTAATFVVPIIALLTGSVAALSPEFFMSGSHAGLGWENVGLFGCTAVAAAWVLMGLGKWNEGRQLDAFTRRLLQVVGGVAVGAAAFWLGELLLISPTPPVETFAGTLWSQPRDPAFVSLGTRPLILEGGRPSLLGYVAFFGTLFGLRRWWWQSDAFRPKRFRVGSVVLSVFLAFLVSTVWTFPQVWAMTWAAVISSAIQLASIWTPPEERFVGREV